MSFVKYMKPKAVSEVTKTYTDRINQYTKEIQIIDALIPVLKKFDGKAYTKRIETAIKEAFPSYHVSMEYVATQAYVRFWNDTDINYENKIRIFLGYTSDFHNGTNFNHELFVSKHCGKENTQAYIDRYTKGLKKVQEFVYRYNKIMVEAQQLNDDATEAGIEFEFDIVLNAERK